jgi:hypothetical protein
MDIAQRVCGSDGYGVLRVRRRRPEYDDAVVLRRGRRL